jgi:hypothetical protein
MSMSESEYSRREMEDHPESEYLSDLRILRRFVQTGSFGYRAPEVVVFQTLKKRYPLGEITGCSNAEGSEISLPARMW